MPQQVCAGQQVDAVGTRLWEDLRVVVRSRRRAWAFVAPVERTIAVGAVRMVRVGLLVALQMVPACKDDAPIGIEAGRKCSRRRVVHHRQRAALWVEGPQAGDRRSLLVLI